MNIAQPKRYFASTHRAVMQGDAIEWEELPSLAASLAQRLTTRGAWRRDAAARAGARDDTPSPSVSPWDATLPIELDAVAPSQPFSESLSGLATREVLEPGVFQHFFGALAPRR
ncbi:MAG TPA: hypothetical protein VFG60_08590 [Burkholderiaceae bacterium]|nr:hypothetical protein [Burkholderiaceae bacterium]